MKAEIKTKEISGIASAIYDMRKPMESKGDSVFTFENNRLELIELGDKDEELLKKLGRAKGGSGHDCVLKDIVVHMDMTMTHDFLLQFYRYHFRDTASSTSKMHCIHKGDISEKCSKWVSPLVIDVVVLLIMEYNDFDKYNPSRVKNVLTNYGAHYTTHKVTVPTTKKELFECIIANTPLGYMLTVGEVTNYLQLKSMWKQRKSHKMSSWSTVFVDWVRSLPYSYLITGEE